MRALQTSSIVDQMLSVQSFQLHICLAASKHDRRRCRSAHILVQDRLDGWSSDCMFCMFEPIYYKLCVDISNAYHMFWLNPVLYGDNHLFSDVFFFPPVRCDCWAENRLEENHFQHSRFQVVHSGLMESWDMSDLAAIHQLCCQKTNT